MSSKYDYYYNDCNYNCNCTPAPTQQNNCNCTWDQQDCCNTIAPCVEECELIYGDVIDLDVKCDDCEIKADLVVKKTKTVRVWGRILDECGKPIGCALVKILRPIQKNGCLEYVGLGHTVTDCMGFYQFDICPTDECRKYKIIVSKVAMGKERELENTGVCRCACKCVK